MNIKKLKLYAFFAWLSMTLWVILYLFNIFKYGQIWNNKEWYLFMINILLILIGRVILKYMFRRKIYKSNKKNEVNMNIYLEENSENQVVEKIDWFLYVIIAFWVFALILGIYYIIPILKIILHFKLLSFNGFLNFILLLFWIIYSSIVVVTLIIIIGQFKKNKHKI